VSKAIDKAAGVEREVVGTENVPDFRDVGEKSKALGGGNNQETGEGYFFTTDGKRFWGKFGAAGALLRRKNNKGEYEYFLAKRSAGLSQGGGKWGYPGGAHKNKFDAFETLPESQKKEILSQPSVAAELRNNFTKNLNALRAEMGLPPLPLESSITPFEELYEEVGPSLSEVAGMVDKGVYVNNVAPDWKYATHLFEVGPDKMKGLSPKDGENSETGWFTSEQISKMANDGDLQADFAETASTILGLLGDDPDTEDAITPEPGDVAPSVLGTTFDTSKWTKVSGQARGRLRPH
jgi:hypothetical protein